MSGLGMRIAAEKLLKCRTEGCSKSYAEGYAEGYAKGYEEGVNMILTLISRLLLAGRSEDIERVTKDPECRNELMKEFNIVPGQNLNEKI